MIGSKDMAFSMSRYWHVLIYTAHLPSGGDRTAAEIMKYLRMGIAGHIYSNTISPIEEGIFSPMGGLRSPCSVREERRYAPTRTGHRLDASRR